MKKGNGLIVALLIVLIICVIAAIAIMMLNMMGIIGINSGTTTFLESEETQALGVSTDSVPSNTDSVETEQTDEIVNNTEKPEPDETTAKKDAETSSLPKDETTAKPAPETTATQTLETTSKPAHTHSWSSWKTLKAATCTESGTEERSCSCGEKETRPVKVLDHATGSWIIDKAATCTTDGSRHKICTRCGATTKAETIRASGHTESSWVIDKIATCTATGSRHKICTVCNVTTKTETIPMKAHSYGSWTISNNATCTVDGTKTRKCSCGKTETAIIAATGHNYVDDKCIVCGAIDYKVKDENLIRNAEDLKKLANSAETFMIVNDIDLKGINWEPIEGFSGTLIGNGCKIKNLTINSSESYVGLFSILEGKVTDLTLENVSITVTGNNQYIGALCGKLDSGDMSDITVSGSIVAENSQYVGGIAGCVLKLGNCSMQNFENSAAVIGEKLVGGIAGYFGGQANVSYSVTTMALKSLTNSGNIKGSSEYIGGIFGCLFAHNTGASQIVTVYDVKNTGDVSGQVDVGGIAGCISTNNSASILENAICESNITAEAKVGCIVGRALVVTLNNCSNKGSTLTATKYTLSDGDKLAYVGGIAGIAYLVNNSANYVTINYTSTGYHVGGIAGYIYGIGAGNIQNLENHANVTGYENVGGIVGSCYYHNDATDSNVHNITGMKNYGTIKSTNGYVGGVIGVLDCYNNQINDIHNYGDVIGTEYVGGIVGWGDNDSGNCVLSSATCKGNISGTAYVGCIAGKLDSISIDSCSNEGSTLTATKYVTVDGNKYAYVGGYVGYGFLVNNCTNTVAINYTSDGLYVGGIMGHSYATGDRTMTNLKNTADINGYKYVGGIIGEWYNASSQYNIELDSFENSGNITATNSYVGGIIGYIFLSNNTSSTVNISNFSNIGSVSGKTYVGGLFGYAKTSGVSYIKNSSNKSAINGEAYVGCIAGRLSSIVVDNCTNAGSTLTATKYVTNDGIKYAYVGGYVGYGYLANNCTNTVNIEYSGGGRYVGGIMGYTDADGTYKMSNLSNTASISGADYVGGIIGRLYNYYDWVRNYSVTLDNFSNSGSITGTSNYVGGILGSIVLYNSSNDYGLSLYATEFSNTGTIIGKQYVGGIIGYGSADATDSYLMSSSNSSSISAESYVGAIAGLLDYITISDCSNSGSTIKATSYALKNGEKYAYVGGFVGYGYLANNCTNTVNIEYSGGGRYVGGIMGYTDADGTYKMSNLSNTASISGADYVGGIIGRLYNYYDWVRNYSVTLDNFSNSGSITGTSNYVGGILGSIVLYNSSNDYGLSLYATEFSNTGTIIGKQYVGGIIGYGSADATDSYLMSSSNSSSISAESYVGAIAGLLDCITITDCSNSGSTIKATSYALIDGDKYAYVGGYVGYGYLANNCTNTVNIEYSGGGKYVGGIIGYTDAEGTYKMSNLSNTATISGADCVGGIIGRLYNYCESVKDKSVTLDNFSNSGSITGTGNYVGGMFGSVILYNYYSSHGVALYATEFINTDTVTGKKYVGGLFGYVETESKNSSIIDAINNGVVIGQEYVGDIGGKIVDLIIK